MVPISSEGQLHPGLAILALVMTPLRVRSAAPRTVLARTPFSHGAVIENVNWLTLGTSRCRHGGGPPVLHGCLDLQASRRSDRITYCKGFASRSARLVAMFAAYLSRQLVTNCGRSRGKTFCSLACLWQLSTLSFSFALLAASSWYSGAMTDG